jgi:hypothetical protein
MYLMLSLKDQHHYNSSFNWILCIIIIIIIITGCLLQFPVEWEKESNSPPVFRVKQNKNKWKFNRAKQRNHIGLYGPTDMWSNHQPNSFYITSRPIECFFFFNWSFLFTFSLPFVITKKKKQKKTNKKSLDSHGHVNSFRFPVRVVFFVCFWCAAGDIENVNCCTRLTYSRLCVQQTVLQFISPPHQIKRRG